MSSLAETFKGEAMELVQELEESLLDLEESPEDAGMVDRVFRVMHTLKGSGALAGFDAVAGFCHEIETVFELVRSGERQANSELVSLTLASQDHLKGMILAEFGADPVDDERTAELVAAFQILLPFAEHKVDKISEQALLQETFQSTCRIRFRPQPNLFCLGVQPQLLIGELANLGEAIVVA